MSGVCSCGQRNLPRLSVQVQPDDSNEEVAMKTIYWRITDPSELLTVNDSVTYVSPGGYAGFCLRLNNSLVYVNSLAAFVSHTVMISMNVKFCGPSCGGVIFAYASSKTTFLLAVQSHISIYVGEVNYQTDLVLAKSSWSQISLVFDRSSLVLQVYVHAGTAARHIIQLDVDILEPYGTMALGNSLPGSSRTSYLSLGGFQGDIDEFTIWDRLFDDNVLRILQTASPVACSPDLVAQWRFDEVTDGTMTDSVSGQTLFLSAPGYQPPAVLTSDLQIGPPGSGIPASDTVLASGLEQTLVSDGSSISVIDVCGRETSVNSWIADFCADVILSGPLGTVCQVGRSTSIDVYSDCVAACESENTTEPALSVVIRYADFCQTALSLSYWPARTLCNRFGNAPFPLWIGDACDIQCVFGSRDPDNRNLCNCNPGYWNISCDRVCPGGSSNPCNGVGTCGILTGICKCPVNWDGAPDCSLCSPGWTGSGCSLARLTIGTNVRVRISMVGLSFITTFTGYTFRFNRIGEYQLLVIAQTQFILQAKFVGCFVSQSCMQHVGFYFGNTIHGYAALTISAAQNPGGFMTVRLNGRPYRLDTEVTFGSVGYVFRRLSLTEILCTGPDGFSLAVRSSGLYITLHTKFPDSVCPVAEGLLVGGCCNADSNSSSPFLIAAQPLRCPNISSVILAPSPLDDTDHDLFTTDATITPACQEGHNGIYSSSVNELLAAWALKDCQSVIGYTSIVIRYQQRISFCLQFCFSVIYSEDLIHLTRAKYDVTFDLTVRLQSTVGVILSYSHYTTFSLYVHGTLEIHIGGVIYGTTLRPQLAEWIRVVVVYSDSDHYVTIYLVSASQEVTRETIRLRGHRGIFRQPGYIALGSWLPGWNDVNVTSLPGFSGYINDCRIWNRHFSPAEVAVLWTSHIPEDADDLMAYWPLNEGQGSVATDLVQGIRLAMPSHPWPVPTWVPSDAASPDTGSPELGNHLDASITVCQRLFFVGPLLDACGLLSEATTNIYHELCLEVADGAGRVEAYSVAFTYADVCQVALNLTLWPARPLCQDVPSLRAGSQCRDGCVNGVDTSGLCICHEGFYGDECQHVCPGGFVTPCSEHGSCDSSGQCRCELNWRGSLDCSSCSDNWGGSECTIVHSSFLLSVGVQRAHFYALITIHTQYVLFDGLVFYFGAVGEFYLIRTASYSLQISQVPCFTEGTCVRALAMWSQGDSITFHGSYTIQQGPVLWHNGRVVSLSSIEIELNGIWRIQQLQPDRYRIFFITGAISVDVQILGVYLQLSVSVPQDMCQGAWGLLGNCNMDVNDDVLEPLGNITQQGINDMLADAWRVGNESLFIHNYGPYVENPIPTGAVFSCRFNKTGAVSKPLNLSIGNTSMTSALTVDIRIKIQATGGVIISLNLGRTLTVYLDGLILRLSDGVLSYDTNITLPLDSWSHIYLIVRADGLLQLYFRTSTAISSTYRVTVSPFDYFLDAFYVSIGQGIIQPVGNNVLLPSSFYGEIDELRIWSGPFHPALIDSGNTVNLYASIYHESIMGLYKFDDIFGVGILDSVQANNLLTPSDPWPYPLSVSSDADITVVVSSPFARPFNNGSLEPEALEICALLYTFQNDSLSNICPNTTEAFMDFFYLSCLRAVATSRSTDAAFATLTAVAEYCSTLGEEPFSYGPLCQVLQNQILPTWLARACKLSCIFGIDDGSGICKCSYGYWGQSCSFECPGGLLSPCKNNGRCFPDGSCECLPNWKGHDCSQCNDGWLGQDCSLGIVHQVHRAGSVAAYFSVHGRVVTFGRATFFLRPGFVYNVLSNTGSGYDIRVRMSSCFNSHGFTLCYDAVHIRMTNHLLTLRVSVDAPFGVYVWINKRLIILDHITRISEDFIITRLNILQYQIQISFEVTITVTVHESKFDLRVIAPSEICDNRQLSGLLAMCDTVQQIPDALCPPSNGSTGILPSNNITNMCSFNGTQSSIENYTSRFTAEEIYNSDYDAHVVLRPLQGAGFYLHFHDSIAVSSELWHFPTILFTLEVYLLPLSLDGVLLSYGTNQGVFALFLSNGSLQVAYESTFYNLDLYIELNVWQQITLVWQQDILTLEVYLFDTHGVVRANAVKFESAIFSTGGRIVIGQWYTPVPLVHPSLPVGPFEGGLDEIRLWTRRTNPSVVTFSWKFNADFSTPDLANLWKMNSGIGSKVFDIVGGQHISLVNNHAPVWQISDDPYTIRIIPTFFFPTFRGNLSDQAHTTCNNIFQQGQLFSNCHGLDTILFTTYHFQCLHDIAYQSDANAAIESTIAFADICQNELSLATWPAQLLCNAFPSRDFPYWIGILCDIPCIFGRKSSFDNSICECENGYWGTACDNVCPGGILTPCSEHGECHKETGICSCDIHWLGTDGVSEAYGCSACSDGWIGNDCSATTIFHSLTDVRLKAVAIFSGGAHVTTFDGASFHFDIPGTYSLLSSERSAISIFVKPCNARIACRELSEVYITSGQQQLSVQVVNSLLSVRLYYQEVWTELEVGLQQSASNGIGFDIRDGTFISITTSDNLIIDIFLNNYLMSVSVYLPADLVLTPYCVLGSWDMDWVNDINVGLTPLNGSGEWTATNRTFFKASVYSQYYIDTDFAQFFRISSDHVQFQHPMASSFLSGSFMLRFQSGLVSFAGLPQLLLDQFSLEMWIQVQDSTRSQQTVLTWQTNALSFVIQGIRLGVVINDRITITTLTISPDIWFHIAITWRNYDGRLLLHLNNSHLDVTESFTVFGVATAEHVTLTDNLWIGGISNEMTSAFVGHIDQIVLRNQHTGTVGSVTERGVYQENLPDDVVLFIPLEEGTGDTTSAQVKNGSSRVRAAGDLVGESPPQWLPSDAPISTSPDHDPTFIPETLSTEAYQACQQLFFEGPLYNKCSSLASTHLFYYESCLVDIAATGHLHAGNISASVFAILCKETLDIEEIELCGFYIYCRYAPKVNTPWWWWILVLIGGIVIILAIQGLCIVRCVRVRRRRDALNSAKSHNIPLHEVPVAQDEEDQGSENPEVCIHETASTSYQAFAEDAL